MKIKLLKAIRKRFSWYYKKDGTPVLMDNWLSTVKMFDVELPKDSAITKEEYNDRLFKSQIFEPFVKSQYMYIVCKRTHRKLKNEKKVRF